MKHKRQYDGGSESYGTYEEEDYSTSQSYNDQEREFYQAQEEAWAFGSSFDDSQRYDW